MTSNPKKHKISETHDPLSPTDVKKQKMMHSKQYFQERCEHVGWVTIVMAHARACSCFDSHAALCRAEPIVAALSGKAHENVNKDLCEILLQVGVNEKNAGA